MALHDWNFMLVTCDKNNVQNAIGFGSGRVAVKEGRKQFRRKNTKSVVVFGVDGTRYLYLSAGHPEKTENKRAPY